MDIKNKLTNLKNRKDILLVVFAVMAAMALGAYALYFRAPALSVGDIRAKAEKFINENLLSQGMKADIKSVVEEGGLYKIVLNIGGGEDIVSYISKDGRKFFPQSMDVAEVEERTAEAKKRAEPIKNDKPEVELFVMSYCPYGTQMEKGILPILSVLGSKINFTLKFVDYAMHDKIEIDENTRQYCVQKEQNDKLNGYLFCFLRAGDAAGCLKSAGVDAGKLNNCVAQTDVQFEITEKFNDKNLWNGQYPPFNTNQADNEKYGVQGSPTLVINGKITPTQRDPASILRAICSAFNNSPVECSVQLSVDQPAPGFGEGTADGATDGNCGQ